MKKIRWTFTTKCWIRYVATSLIVWALLYPWGLLTGAEKYIPLRFSGALLLLFPKFLLLHKRGMWPNPFWPKDAHREKRVTRVQHITGMLCIGFEYAYLMTPGRIDALIFWMALDVLCTAACVWYVRRYYESPSLES